LRPASIAFFILAASLPACGSQESPDAPPPAAQTSPEPRSPVPAKEFFDEPLTLTPRDVVLRNGKVFALNVPEGFDIQVASEGLRRPRFMAVSPDQRIFITDMLSLLDNSRGSVSVLGKLDKETGRLNPPIPDVSGLRNPNSIAFHTDPAGRKWLYLALTNKLVRYPYNDGGMGPSGEPETLATFPDKGLGYKQGGWHLTRTVVIGPNHKVYVSVGSSCNVCDETEEIRATISEMDLDGSNARIIARGLRNAVGLKFADGHLYATNMGADHLGDDRPEETMYKIEPGADYGWPYCYEFEGKVYADDKLGATPLKKDCSKTPLAFATFAAHSSPLGVEYFDSGYFLVALHGSSKRSLTRGYRIARVKEGRPPEDFITGFQQGDLVHGRPVDILRVGTEGFLISDDHAGVVYYVHKKTGP
jgi:glucose/arabinose dehydrogenase